MELTLLKVPSPMGELVVAMDGQGRVRAAEFISFEARMRDRLARRYGEVTYTRQVTGMVELLRAKLARYFVGELGALADVEVVAEGQELELKVWKALREIPAGTTTSYGALAKALGFTDPRMAREIGAAIGANPVAVIVPCHRVIAKDGSLKGFAWGLTRKRQLLEHEGCLAPAAQQDLLEEVAV